MAYPDHIPQHNKHLYGLKIAELAFSALLVPLSAFEVAVGSWDGNAMALFTALFSLIVLTYNLVALRPDCHQAYNWIALLILECLAVIFWLTTWALHAAALAASTYSYSNSYTYDYDGYYYKRDLLTKRLLVSESTYNAWIGIFYVVLAFSIVNFILFCVSLGLMAAGIHRHRLAGRPMAYGQPVTETNVVAKHEASMQPELSA